jgi:glycosyltransferase involved in cell wall biosynthesis
MQSASTITAVVIALNEAERIGECLQALSWADERLVVDGGSNDKTVDLALAAGAKVVSRPFDDFARQRNHALAVADGDWVLFVDADERPSAGFAAELRRRIQTGRQQAFRVPIRSRIFGRRFRFSGTQDDRPVRVVKRSQGAWVGAMHEVLVSAGPIGELQRWLAHSTTPDREVYRRKMQRYTTIEARSRVAAGRRPTWYARWLAPPREVFRRLIWKQGWLDGPEGWAFCLLSGLTEWTLANKHRQAWACQLSRSATPRTASGKSLSSRRARSELQPARAMTI